MGEEKEVFPVRYSGLEGDKFSSRKSAIATLVHVDPSSVDGDGVVKALEHLAPVLRRPENHSWHVAAAAGNFWSQTGYLGCVKSGHTVLTGFHTRPTKGLNGSHS